MLFADTAGEKPETLAFLSLIATYLHATDFPLITTVRSVPRDFKHWRPYHTLEENDLTTGTLPSLAFGFKSCSQKWKIAPQHRYLQHQEAMRAHWRRGGRVTQCIGFDAGPVDLRRRANRGDPRDRYYDDWYPLIDWGWNRARCREEIAKAGLPVPPKSSCFFCPAIKPAEVRQLPPALRRRIMLLEARAAPRLRTIAGLWRNGSKGTRSGEPRPGSITACIRQEQLVPAAEIAALEHLGPPQIVAQQQRFQHGEPIPTWPEFLTAVASDHTMLRSSPMA